MREEIKTSKAFYLMNFEKTFGVSNHEIA